MSKDTPKSEPRMVVLRTVYFPPNSEVIYIVRKDPKPSKRHDKS